MESEEEHAPLRARPALQRQITLNAVELDLQHDQPALFAALESRVFAEFESELSRSGLHIVRTISAHGQTVQGAVYEVLRAADGRRLACKWLMNPERPYASRRLREMRSAAMLPPHPNIVRLVDSGSLGRDEYLLFDLCDQSLDQFLVLRKFGSSDRVTREFALSFAWQLFSGLAAIHACAFCHKNIHPGSVFLTRGEGADPAMAVQLGDLGLAEPCDGPAGEGRFLSPRATCLLAPELCALRHNAEPAADYTMAQDVWSAGAVLLLVLLPPAALPVWKAATISDTLLHLGQCEAIAADIQARYGDLVWSLLVQTVFEPAAEHRPAARAVLHEMHAALPATFAAPAPPAGPLLPAMDALVQGAVLVASARRRAKSPDAATFKDIAAACVEYYGEERLLPATRFLWRHSAVLFMLPALQELVALARCGHGPLPWDAFEAEEARAAAGLDAAGEFATDDDVAGITGTRAAFALERVKALGLLGRHRDGVRAAAETIMALQPLTDAARLVGASLVAFQHCRSTAALFNACWPSLCALPESAREGVAPVLSAEHILSVLAAGAADLEAVRAATHIRHWRDEWALRYEKATLLMLLDRFQESLGVCDELAAEALAGQQDWMLHIRAVHLRFTVLERALLRSSETQEGFVEVATVTESPESAASLLLDLYEANMASLKREAYGYSNCRQHCHDLRQYARNSAGGELLDRIELVWQACVEVIC